MALGAQEGGVEVAFTGQTRFLTLRAFQPENSVQCFFSGFPKTLLPAVGPTSDFSQG